MPKVRNNDVIRFSYFETIRAIHSRDKLNMVEWVAARMIECKLDRSCDMVFQPYIMALVNHKTVVLDVDDEVHKAFCPFKNKKEVLEREVSPPIEVAIQLQATGQLKQSFHTLYQHVYRYCPQPSTNTVIGIFSSLITVILQL